VAGTPHTFQWLEYSGTIPGAGLTGTIHSCGLGYPGDFPQAVAGNIALIQRGTLTFATKVLNAMNAGAAAAVIYDNVAGGLTVPGWTLGGPGTWIPAAQVTQASGQAILAQLPASGTLTSVKDPTLAYQFLSGTSMASPHVAGAVAFAALNFPAESVSQRIARIKNHVTPVAALAGKMTTGGRLNLLNIVDTDADSLPDWWETESFGNLAQSAATDADGDGFPNLDEFLAGTHPQDPAVFLAFATATPVNDGGENHFVLTFPSVEDRRYRIQWSHSLDGASWSDLGGIVTGTGGTMEITDPGALDAAPLRFYRMRVLPE
jgi:subtilisin family serine protease